MALQQEIAAGQTRGRRDMLRISGTGCICAVPELKTFQRNGKENFLLKVKVASNDSRKIEDGKSIKYTEFTDLTIWGERAKALAGILANGTSIEFSGRFRGHSFNSDRYFQKTDSGGIDLSSPCPMYRVECNIDQTSWVTVTSWPSEERKAKNAAVAAASPEGQAQAANAAIPPNLADAFKMMAQFQELAAKMAKPQNVSDEQVVDLPPVEQQSEPPNDEDIPF